MKSAPLANLELVLEAWAAQTALPPQRALVMRAEILALTPDLEPEIDTQPLPTTWWFDFSTRLNEQLHQSLHALAPNASLHPATSPAFGWSNEHQCPFVFSF